MDKFNISIYLQDFNNGKHCGKCRACQKDVQWTRERVAAHKRSNCPAASIEEKKRFAKRILAPPDDSGSDVKLVAEQSSTSECPRCNLNEDKTKEINSKVANFFFRTGISLRLIDSNAFKELITTLNPFYAKSMPCSKTLSGSIDQRTRQKACIHLCKLFFA